MVVFLPQHPSYSSGTLYTQKSTKDFHEQFIPSTATNLNILFQWTLSRLWHGSLLLKCSLSVKSFVLAPWCLVCYHRKRDIRPIMRTMEWAPFMTTSSTLLLRLVIKMIFVVSLLNHSFCYTYSMLHSYVIMIIDMKYYRLQSCTFLGTASLILSFISLIVADSWNNNFNDKMYTFHTKVLQIHWHTQSYSFFSRYFFLFFLRFVH